jgi:phage portal protein BeeE
VTQGAGETRIAAAAGVPPVIVGLSEGLQAATYSNYSQARRRFADGTMRPLWRNAAVARERS